MIVRVDLFALARELAGTSQVQVELSDRARVCDLRHALAVQCPALREMLSCSMIAVNEDYAAEDMLIPLGASVACIPPVSGGAASPLSLIAATAAFPSADPGMPTEP